MEREEPHYQMFTDIFSRLIIRDAVRTGEDKNNETEVMKYAVTDEKATKSVHFAEKNVKGVFNFAVKKVHTVGKVAWVVRKGKSLA